MTHREAIALIIVAALLLTGIVIAVARRWLFAPYDDEDEMFLPEQIDPWDELAREDPGGWDATVAELVELADTHVPTAACEDAPQRDPYLSVLNTTEFRLEFIEVGERLIWEARQPYDLEPWAHWRAAA